MVSNWRARFVEHRLDGLLDAPRSGVQRTIDDIRVTPTSASWLNQVERWFATLTQRCIRRGTLRYTPQLEQTIRGYFDINNAEPKPFVWSKTADDTLASIERFCLRTSNSPH